MKKLILAATVVLAGLCYACLGAGSILRKTSGGIRYDDPHPIEHLEWRRLGCIGNVGPPTPAYPHRLRDYNSPSINYSIRNGTQRRATSIATYRAHHRRPIFVVFHRKLGNTF